MFPDVLGLPKDKGILRIKESGVRDEDIIIQEYLSPKKDIIGDSWRIIKMDSINSKVILTIGNF